MYVENKGKFNGFIICKVESTSVLVVVARGLWRKCEEEKR